MTGGVSTKTSIKSYAVLVFVPLLLVMISTSAFAITEAEIEAQIDAAGRESVTGSVLIWFLCAIGFLKVSQKIDSFMASLGVNVGHTGGSMLAEVMIATKGVASAFGSAGHVIGSGRHSSGPSSVYSGAATFFKGGLAGVVTRKVTNDAVKSATTSTSAVISRTSASSTQSATDTQSVSLASQHQSFSGNETSQQMQSKSAFSRESSHTASSVQSSQRLVLSSHSSLGGAIFARSLMSGGSFANDVIGTVAKGDMRSMGSITGELASQALMSYMGYTALGPAAQDIPHYSDVEIGGGRITGTETTPGSSSGLAFGMYQADQYMPPQGDYSKVYSADGVLWYKQYAQDAVERRPYEAPDGTVAYHERVIKKLPDPPKRKDRV